MEQYIKKSALVAEIGRRLEKIANASSENNRELFAIRGAQQYELINLAQYINTLEVKEVDLENSMVCEAKWHDGFLLDYTQEQQDALLEKIGANVGDKVRIILIKE